MSFSCPHFDINRDWCRRLNTDCVPGRRGCVLDGGGFAVPAEQRVRERDEEKKREATRRLFGIGGGENPAAPRES
jgi:hypothetical protein